MSEFFLELFSEEIPSDLQQNLREDLLKSFNDFFLEKSILFKKSSSYSTPNRLVVLFEGVQKNVVLKSEEIKGPNIKSPDVALEGFIRSNKTLKKDLYQKKTDKGEFYFFKTKSKKLNTYELLQECIPILLNKIQWKKSISFKKSSSYSTPNRLVVLFEGVQKNVVLKSEEIKGPNIKSPEVALEGFVRSNKILKKDLYQKKTDKGEFYFFKTKSKKLHTHELLEEFIPILLSKIQWKKSMYWGTFDLNWGRPLKSILAVFDKKKLNFNFHHLTSSNSTFIDKEFEENKKSFLEFKNYKSFFKKKI